MEADEPFLSENEKKIVILDVEPPENPRIYLRRQPSSWDQWLPVIREYYYHN